MGATASRPGAAAGSGDSANTRGNGGPVASIKFGALGGGDGAADTPLRREFQPFAGWSLDDVRELRKRFQKTVFGFSLVEPQFESLLAFKPGLGAETGVGLAGVFQLLDNDHDGRIDGLELMGGLALCCKGSFEEKARFCFELYDFNLNATLSKPELVMMMQTSMCGLIILTGGGESAEPPLTLLETLAEEAFVCADLDRSGSIGFTEFVDWARSSREVMTCVERLSRVASMPPTATLSDDPDSADEASTTDYESDEELEAEEDITRVAAGGDEFMSVKPWLGAIKEPTAWKGSSAGTQEPGSNLQLSWVHGYSSRTCGSNLHVLSNGSIVYPAAALAVVYDPASHAQKFYAGHSGEVISLRVHPRGHVVATGEAGKVPSVHVWDSRTLECLAVLEGFHARGVNLLAFSPDGERLMTAGLDDNHSLALYEWAAAGKSSAGKSAALLATGKGHRNPLHALEFAPDGQRAWAVGVKCIRHFKQDGRSLTSKAAILGKAGTIQAFHSVGFVGRDAVVGCASGELYRFQEDGRLGQTVAAHPAGESVLSLAPSPATGGLFSGAKDGTVMTWDSSLKQVGPTVDLMEDLDGDGRADHGSLNAAVVSVSCASDAAGTPRSGTSGSRFVVGTRSGDIFEVVVPSNATSHPQVSRLATAHANGEVWGLAAHPTLPEFCSCGDDKTLRKWSLRRRQQLAMRILPSPSRAASYSPDGGVVAVGMLNGAVGIIAADGDLSSSIASWRHCQKAVTDIKYSPDAGTLAVGAQDGNIYLYNTTDCGRGKYSRRTVCRGHSSRITHLDFSGDSKLLQSNCGAYELLFWDARSGTQVRSATAVRDTAWATWTCTLGWPVQGIWPAEADGTDINSVDRCSDVIATGNDRGALNLFKYPCPSAKAVSRQYHGHSSHVTGVRFAWGGRCLLSVGGRDRSIFVWKHTTQDANDSSAEHEGQETLNADGLTDMLAVPADQHPRSGGDEFMAIKPWLGAVKAPTWAADVVQTSTDVDLTLERVHGYRSQDCRNNIRYTASGDVVYPAAAMGVVWRRSLGAQSFLRGTHNAAVLCLALHPEGRIAASGEAGKDPRLVVWDVETLEVIIVFRGCHKRGISHVAFGPSGDTLVSLGMDDGHSMCIHNWSQGRLLSTGMTDKGRALGLCVSPEQVKGEGELIVTCGQGHVKFWSRSGKNLVCQKAIWNGKCKRQTMVSAAALSSSLGVLTGGSEGALCRWMGHKMCESQVHHSKPINALTSILSGEVLTGDALGLVLVWRCTKEGGLRPIRSLSLRLLSHNPAVRAIDLRGSSLLVGTLDSTIWEVPLARALPFPAENGASGSTDGALDPASALAKDDAAIITSGHASGELWGLATHPTNPTEFATAGDDALLQFWRVNDSAPLRSRKLPSKARCIAWGADIAVALTTGDVVVIDASSDMDAPLKATLSDPKQWMQCLSYSPDGTKLAVGSHDRNIYIYNVGAEYGLLGVCKGHSSYVTHLDWSADSQWIQSNSGAYELLFHSASTCKQETGASGLRDVEWATWTCTLGWPVQGIWPAAADGTDINAVARSHTYKKVPVLVCGDDSAHVRLLGYPCVDRGAPDKVYAGHGSHVTSAAFTANDAYLITTGGADRCILVWKTDCIEEARELAAAVTAADAAQISGEPPLRDSGLPPPEEYGIMTRRQDVRSGGGDEFLSVKPWMGAIREPSSWSGESDCQSPTPASLSLAFVHGCQTQAVRGSVVYGESASEIVFHSASVGVVFDRDHGRQIFNLTHTDDIISMAVHPKGHLIATGELGKKPSIAVWDTKTGAALYSLRGFHRRGVCNLAFSASGDLLASVGLDDDHSIAVHSLAGTGEPRLVAHSKGDKSKVLCTAFGGETEILTGGPRHVKFWSLGGAGQDGITSKKGIFGEKASGTTVVAGAYVQGGPVTGHADGTIGLWKGRACAGLRKAHDGAVNCMSTPRHHSRACLCTGGKDGRVVLWDSTIQPIMSFDMTGSPLVAIGEVRSADCVGNKLLVATVSSDVFEIDVALADGSPTRPFKLLEGHYKGELWGIAASPSHPHVATCGDDGTVRVWDSSMALPLYSRQLGGKARAVAYSPDGKHVAVGKYGGDIVVLSSDLGKVVAERNVAKEWIQCMAYSPNGATLAVGSHDNAIYLMETGAYARRAVCRGHSSYITHLDFSCDSKYLQSNCGAYELLFWDAVTGKQIRSATSLRNVQWATWTCTLGWPVQGIWPSAADGTDVNSVCRAPGGRLLASGDDSGAVKLFRYPCVQKASVAKAFRGHSSHVAGVVFTKDGRQLFSVGGNDRALMRWNVAQSGV